MDPEQHNQITGNHHVSSPTINPMAAQNPEQQNDHEHSHALSAAGLIIALGIIYGDIGTSPLYVMKAIVGEHAIDDRFQELIFGGMSCVFWTMTLITTVKYVILALSADNNGEGGIFALYALVRKYKAKWIIFPAMIGCAAVIADGFITPPISISSAVEGLRIYLPHLDTVPIVIGILIGLFSIQQFGTTVVGRAFGPIMFIWFIMMGVVGFSQFIQHPEILQALNPYWAINLLTNYPTGFWILGAVFLCTTGAESMYSDLGHCGRDNIRVSWGFVKVMLLLNYLGQSAWLLYEFKASGATELGKTIPFFAIMPQWFLPFGIGIATLATIIASQALITGTFTLVNEAMKLKLWANLKVQYTSQIRGQIYLPAINWLLLAGCIIVVLIFRESSRMEAAYGLAITIDMLMTTSLISYYLYTKRTPGYLVLGFAGVYALIEGSFFLSNLIKFTHGGWFALMIASIMFGLMYIFYRARRLKDRYMHNAFVNIRDYIPMFEDLQQDNDIPKESTNLVYLAMADRKGKIDRNIIYSIFYKRPKRADIYWFVHVEIGDKPYGTKYSVDTIIPKKCFFIRLRFGFKVEHKVNYMFSKIVNELVANGEVDEVSGYDSLKKYQIPADFKFIILNSRVSVDNQVSPSEQFIINSYRTIKSYSLSPIDDFGLDVSNVEIETVPIDISEDVKIAVEKEHDNTPIEPYTEIGYVDRDRAAATVHENGHNQVKTENSNGKTSKFKRLNIGNKRRK